MSKKSPVTDQETTIFAYSSGKLVAEYSPVVTPVAEARVAYTTTDHLGTPRVITDQYGQVISRRDFMPFGEELAPAVGARAAIPEYSALTDKIRQKFTGYQKDTETSLDFAEARMYENRLGRFTAVDPLLASGKSANPQTFNRYSYTSNNPVSRIDKNGRDWWDVVNNNSGKREIAWFDDDPDEDEYSINQRWTNYVYKASDKKWYALDPNSDARDFFYDENAAKSQYGKYTNFADLDYFPCNLAGCSEIASLVANMRTGDLDGALYEFEKISAVNGAGAGLGRFLAPIGDGFTNLGLHEIESQGIGNATTALVPKAATSLGRWGEARLAQVLGNAGEVPTKAAITSTGARRFFDRLVDGIAHEAKAGMNVKWSSTIERQILADRQLIDEGIIRGAHWHFFQGASKEVLEFLTKNGIPYTLH